MIQDTHSPATPLTAKQDAIFAGVISSGGLTIAQLAAIIGGSVARLSKGGAASIERNLSNTNYLDITPPLKRGDSD